MVARLFEFFLLLLAMMACLATGFHFGKRHGLPIKEYFPNAILFGDVRCFPSKPTNPPPQLEKKSKPPHN